MKTLFVPLSVLLLLSSCAVNPDTRPEPEPEPKRGEPSGGPTMLYVTHSSMRLPSGDSTVLTVEGWLHHPDSSIAPLDGGTLTLNGVPVPRFDELSGWTSYFYRSSDGGTLPARFDGGYEVFRTEGGSGFPAFTDSIRGIEGVPDMTHPLPADTISASSPITIRWNSRPGSTDSVWVGATRPVVGSAIASLSFGYFPDEGSATVPVDILRKWAPGTIELSIGKRRYREDSIPSIGAYRMQIVARSSVRVYIR